MPAFEEMTVVLPDGYAAYARYWSPTQPRGAVLYHHGIQSHCGWYESSAAFLREAGFAVLQVDRRGCGRNEQDRSHADSADQLIHDALTGAAALETRSGMDGYHVVGVSWGGKLAVSAYVTDHAHVRSLSLVTPGLFPRVGVSKVEKARIGLAMLYAPKETFDIPLNDAELFTRDLRWANFIETDPLTLRQCTAGFFLASRRMDKMVMKLPTTRPVPVHLILAEDERIVENERTAEFVRRLHWPYCRLTTFVAARHSLEFEEHSPEYFEDLTAFIAQQ